MTASRTPGPIGLFPDRDRNYIDKGTLCRDRSPTPGPVLGVQKSAYSYSISGTTGALGGMLFTEMSRLPGTLYDRTGKTMAFITKEAELGMSKYADKDFRKSAKKMRLNLKIPAKVDVDIHFETKDRVEDILVRGQRGVRSFRFDFDAVTADQKKLPKQADPFKPFNDTIAQILIAVEQVR
jgi:hypothetical protein